MTGIKSFSRIAAAVAVVSVLAVPVFAARGSADFTRFVTLGDSYGAGVSSIGLNVRHQRYSWPAVIARQVGLNTDCTTDGPNCFQIPYISEPGILPELELTSLGPLGVALKPGLGAPLNSGLARPYNNMSIDGAEVADLINGPSGDGNEGLNSNIVTRGLGTPVEQVLRLNPTFIAIWIGGNDAFNGVQSGRPSRMTALADFTRDYNTLLDKLTAGAPNAGMVVGNLPTDISKVPFTNVIPPVLVDRNLRPVLGPDGKPIPLIADLGGGQFGQLPPGSLVLLTAQQLIARGFGIPAALAPILPGLPDIGKPLPDEQVLTPTEVAAINQRLVEYNSAISAAAATRDITVVDINAWFQSVVTGYRVGPFVFNASYITGGVISLDGYHLTDIGYTLFANQYIRTVNRAHGTKIPVASIAQFLANNDPSMQGNSLLFGDWLTLRFVPEFTPEASAALRGNQ